MQYYSCYVVLISSLFQSVLAGTLRRDVLLKTRVYSPAHGVLSDSEEQSRTNAVEAHMNGRTNGPSYMNHPYAKHMRRTLEERGLGEMADRILLERKGRGLQEEDDDEEEDVWQPMRIKADVSAIESRRDGSSEMNERIDFVVEIILPLTLSFWSQALDVVPVDGNLVIDNSQLANREYCGDSEFTKVAPSHVTDGIPGADLVLYISGSDSSRFCPAGGQTLAVAVACNFDAFDRPTAGAINFCLDKIDVGSIGDPAITQDNVDVAIHETGHVLGMSGNSYKYFWDPIAMEPRTERPLKASVATCVDGTQRTTVLPAENTMKFLTAANGQRYATIVTEKVATVARNQFNCQTLEGGQLENQPTGSSCHGDHWDERLFYPENLSGVVSSFNNHISPITLALYEDSGWYRSNYTLAEVSPWGHGVGCEFVSEPCIVSESVPEYGRGYFCSSSGKRGCSADHTHKLACSMIDYSLRYPPNPPPPAFQYFSDPNVGGPRQADFCPVFGSTYGGNEASELDCRVSGNSPSLNLYSEVYGRDSMCVETSTGEGRCYPVQCIYDERVVKIQIRGEWETCDYDFQEKSLSSTTGFLGGTVYCPRLSSACPDLFCPKNCAGAGKCNFDSIVNDTLRPTCECFDETDTSLGCSDTVTNDGKYLQDSSKLSNSYSETWLDPLLAIFIDDPEYWSDASWGWAAALFALLLMLVFCICSSFWPSGGNSKGQRKR